MTVVKLPGKRPKIAEDSFIAPSATVIGNVEVWDSASIWYDCVINGTDSLRKGTMADPSNRLLRFP